MTTNQLWSSVNESTDDYLIRSAQEHGTPMYVYDLGVLRARILEMKSCLSEADARLYFATMANDRECVLDAISGEGVGACVNSTRHLELAMKCGFTDIQFTSTGLSRSDMMTLKNLGVAVNLDSAAQLSAWRQVGGRVAGLRINAASFGKGLGFDRIGIEASKALKTAMVAREGGCSINGLHVYLGTNFQSHHDMFPTLEAFFDLAATIDGIEYVNVGGGIGVNYAHSGQDFDLRAFGKAVAIQARKLRAITRNRIDVIVEPGRSLVASCGTFVAAVTDLKVLNGKKYAALDASIAIFPRPYHHPESLHRIRSIGAKGARSVGDEVSLVGRTTFSRDILGRVAFMHDLEVGTLVAFDDAGAYSQSMTSRFLGQSDPVTLTINRSLPPALNPLVAASPDQAEVES